MIDDTKIPLISEEAFQHGFTFNVKMIGWMDIPRPLSRIEIVAAMRRVRVEFKTKGLEKRKVTLSISVDGVKTTLRKRTAERRRPSSSADDIVLKLHPICRIFYVSHDSQDVKIFSYISRETPSNKFQCSVFKASSKKQALRIVKTVGQAFEVCQKLGTSAVEESEVEEAKIAQELAREKEINRRKEEKTVGASPTRKDAPSHDFQVARDKHEESRVSSMRTPQPRPPPQFVDTWRDSIAAQHETQFLREKLEQQSMSTQAAVAQINLLRDQLAAESAARVEAQNRTQQLLLHNKELLDHLQTLVRHIQELEGPGSPNLPQVPPAAASSPTPNHSSSLFQEIEALRRQNAALLDTILYENNRLFIHHQTSPGPIRLTLSPATLTPTYYYPGLVVSNSQFPTPQLSPRGHGQDGLTFGNSRLPPLSLPSHDNFARQTSQLQNEDRSYHSEVFSSIPPSGAAGRLQPPKLCNVGRQASADAYGSTTSSPKSSLARSVSERVGHKSELMGQVQRTAWARHTTK